MNEPSLTEREAVLLRWRALHPNAPPGALPSEQEAAALLTQIRGRMAGVEAEELQMLMRSLAERSTGGGTLAIRYGLIALLVCAVIAAVWVGIFYAVVGR